MKSLKFTHTEAEDIKNGKQKATLRMHDEKDLSVDDEIAIIDKVQEEDEASWVIIGTGKINKVVNQKIGDLDVGEGIFEKFGSMTELYEKMALFYGDKIDDNVHIKVVYFDFEPFKAFKTFAKPPERTKDLSEIKMYSDGGSRGNPGPSASGYVLMDMDDNVIETNGEYLKVSTNNQAEYHSLRLGLTRAKQLGAKKVDVYMDSLLVINQMKGLFKVKNPNLQDVYMTIKDLVKDFEAVKFNHVPRELNKLADAEVNRILDSNKNMV
ncbi:reverse transcriptase-like protein [Candidatus Saccharibacteria bacterium]|nr:reverse transcriptase-like protein [Candidatus Saccharibacteria bacterium]